MSVFSPPVPTKWASRFRAASLITAGVLLLCCSGILRFNVKDFEPLSANLMTEDTTARFEKINLGYGGKEKHLRVDSGGVRLWMYGGEKWWTGYRAKPSETRFRFKVENNSDAPLALSPNDIILRPTRVPARWFGKPYNGAPLPVASLSMTASDKSDGLWREGTELDPNEAFVIEPGRSAELSVGFVFPNVLRKGFLDITLRNVETNEPYIYRFRMKKD